MYRDCNGGGHRGSHGERFNIRIDGILAEFYIRSNLVKYVMDAHKSKTLEYNKTQRELYRLTVGDEAAGSIKIYGKSHDGVSTFLNECCEFYDAIIDNIDPLSLPLVSSRGNMAP